MNYRQHLGYFFGLSLVSISLIFLVLIFLFIVCRRKAIKAQSTATILKPSARSYTLADIHAATEGFSPRRIIGEGRLGTVYAAVSESAEFIAVKRIHPFLVLTNTGFDFSLIIKSLSLARHPHIVPIIGFSEAPGERIIVMDFVGVVSLDYYLHQNPDGSPPLEWTHRIRIAAGAARGLQYLHEEMAPSVVHGCVKPSNILIDVKFCARICDYGLTFLASKQKKGVEGYVDDEYWERGGCKETDVYGFGVVLLEILTGRSCEEGWLVKWALPLIKGLRFNELFDPRIVMPFDANPLVRLARVASACVANSRMSRPTMGQIAAILSNLEIELLKYSTEVEETGGKIPEWDGKDRESIEMTWCNDTDDEPANQIITSKLPNQTAILTCPSCGHHIELQDQGIHDLPGLPAGVKFDPTDQEILQHLEAKMGSDNKKLHPLIDEFIPTLEGENGICYTHPEKLPGVSKDGQIRHFFHRPSKAYTTGTRKRRKVHSEEDGSETRWHKTGKTRPVFAEGTAKGFKKILVLYTNYGRQKKPEKTNWVMHQYHLGNNEEEKDGELVVSKVFFQTQPRQCGSNNLKDPFDMKLNQKSGYDSSDLPKNRPLVEYYSPSFMSYDNGDNDREIPPQLIPNLGVQGDGSTFIRLATDGSKCKLERRQ